MSDQPEHRLQCLVVDVLRLLGKPGLYFTAIPNGEYRSKRTAARLKRAGTRAGAPDLLLIWDGRAIGLELKTEKGRQSPEQRIAEQEWASAGGLYKVCRGYRETADFLLGLGCIKPIHDSARFAPRQMVAA